MRHGDVCICNEEDADRCLGVAAANTDVSRGELDISAYERLATRLRDEFEFDTVAITLRESISATRNRWSALVADRAAAATPHRSMVHDIPIVDREGGGDSFAAGLIAQLIEGAPAGEAVEFAVAASCLKHTIPGDFNHVTRAEVERMLATKKPDVQVEFVGPYAQPDLPLILRDIDVLVVPSLWWESYCLTIREGLLAGCIVVAAAHGPMTEALLDGELGLLFEPGSPHDLCRQLQRLFDEPELVPRLRNRGAQVKTIEQNAR